MQLTSGQLYSQRNKASSVYKPDFIVPLTAWPDSHFGYWAQPATPASPPGAPAACFSCPPVADPASCEPHRAPPFVSALAQVLLCLFSQPRLLSRVQPHHLPDILPHQAPRCSFRIQPSSCGAEGQAAPARPQSPRPATATTRGSQTRPRSHPSS